jgi:iron complex outermembrane receptor protein
MRLRTRPGGDPLGAAMAEGQQPAHQLLVWTGYTPRPDVQLDAVVRYVGRLPAFEYDAYAVADARVGWTPIDHLELALVGRNLLSARHPEFAAFFIDTVPSQTQQEVYGTVRWQF